MFVLSMVIGGSLFPACGGDESKTGGENGDPAAEGEDSLLKCANACAKIDECEKAASACQQSCASFAAKLSNGAAQSIMDCITQASCDRGNGVDPPDDLEDDCIRLAGCSESNTALLDASKNAKTRCGCVDYECAALDDDLRLEACFNNTATRDLVNCLETAECPSTDTCDTFSWRGTYHESDK